MSNPLLEPIHGVSLYDYAVISAKMAAGLPEADILKTLGIEKSVFEEASAVWITRMQEDSTFEVVQLFGQYFGDADSHPKLGSLKAEMSEDATANLERLKTDRQYYEELSGARLAAYDHGLDGAQWVQDTFGINLGDFQSVAMQWMPITNSEDSDTILAYAKYREQKQEEYAEKFASEMGGNIADDVEF